MQGVVNRLLSCPVVCGFVSGALRWVTLGRTQRLPAARGDTQGVATPITLADIQGTRAEETSNSLRVPWIATAVVCQATPGLRKNNPKLLQCTALD